jgi:hypothetical protein
LVKEEVLHNVVLILLVLQEPLEVQVVVEEVKIQVLETLTQEVLLIKCHQCLHLYNLLVLETQEVMVLLVVCLLIDKVEEVVEQAEQEILLVQVVEQVDQVKMFLLFLDRPHNLFILQTDLMLDHQLEVFLLVEEEVDNVLHQETLTE